MSASILRRASAGSPSLRIFSASFTVAIDLSVASTALPQASASAGASAERAATMEMIPGIRRRVMGPSLSLITLASSRLFDHGKDIHAGRAERGRATRRRRGLERRDLLAVLLDADRF